MTAHQLIGPLPLLSLDSGCTITVEAIDPDTGANVSGVLVSEFAMLGNNAVAEPTPVTADPLFAHESPG